MAKYQATDEEIEAVAAALANSRGMRRGMPPIVNVLDLVPDDLREEFLEDAQAAIEAYTTLSQREE